MSEPIPTSSDVVAYLNERFESLGLPYRLKHIEVLPYPNPMWLANWNIPELDYGPDRAIVEEELRDARWKFPQVTQDY